MLKRVLCIFIIVLVLLGGCGIDTNISSGSSEAASEVTAVVSSRIKLDFGKDSFLQQLLDQKWQHDSVQAVLGKRDAYYNRYDVYFDQGISVKYSELTTQHPDDIGYFTEPVGNIENILLNEKYNDVILNGISMKSTKGEIINCLGEPKFTDDSLNLFGYRADDFYLFFIGNDRIDEISIYPVFTEENQAELIRQAQALCKERAYSRELAEKLAAEFAAEFKNCNYYFVLTFQNRWTSRAGKVGYASYTAGIEIQWDDDKQVNPILQIYANSGLEAKTADIVDQDGNVLVRYLPDDLVFTVEQNRIYEKAEAAQRAIEEGVVSPDGNITLVNNYDWASPLVTGFHVLYKDGSKPDFTVLTSPAFINAAWVNDRYFICNYLKVSLMIYDLQTKQSRLLSRSMYFLEVLDNRIVVLDGGDGTEINILYSFDKDASIVLSCDSEFFLNEPWTETNP